MLDPITDLEFHLTIHGLRSAGGKDAAILDLLHLLELHEPPVRLRVAYLQDLWQCSQPQVSRRMNAIGDLGCCRVISQWGHYRLSMEQPLPKEQRMSQLQINRQRWAALQQQWREAQHA